MHAAGLAHHDRATARGGAREEDRYDAGGDPSDLDDAVAAGRRAIEVTLPHDDATRPSAPESPEAPGYLNNFGNALRLRFERSLTTEEDDAGETMVDISDLAEAVSVHRAAVERCDSRAPIRAGRGAQPGDVDRAIAAYRTSIAGGLEIDLEGVLTAASTGPLGRHGAAP